MPFPLVGSSLASQLAPSSLIRLGTQVGAGFASLLGKESANRDGGATAATSAAGSSKTGQSGDSADRVEALRRQAQESLLEFNQHLLRHLDRAGVDNSYEIQLSSDGAGGVSVGDDHPNRELIEQILREHPELVDEFQRLARMYKEVELTDKGEAGWSSLIPPVFQVVVRSREALALFE